MTTKEKTVLKGYSFLISNLFRIIIFILIAINLALISVVNKSIFMWIEKLGTSMLLSGVLTAIVGVITGIVLRNSTGINSINTNGLIIPSIIVGVIGLLIVIIYRIVEYKRGDQNELPEISIEEQ